VPVSVRIIYNLEYFMYFEDRARDGFLSTESIGTERCSRTFGFHQLLQCPAQLREVQCSRRLREGLPHILENYPRAERRSAARDQCDSSCRVARAFERPQRLQRRLTKDAIPLRHVGSVGPAPDVP
jgi:hypothetical protein